MKVTEQKTKSLTFLFNKDEEYNSFIDLLFEGVDGLEKRGGSVGTPQDEVIESLKRNVLNGHPRVPEIKISDENGPWHKNSQGQWGPQGTVGPIPMPTYTV